MFDRGDSTPCARPEPDPPARGWLRADEGDGPQAAAARPSGRFRLTAPNLLAFAAGVCSLWLWPRLPPLPLLVLAGPPMLVMVARLAAPVRQAAACALVGLAWVTVVAGHALEQRLAPGLEGVDLVATGRILDLPRRDPDALRFVFCPERARAARQPVAVAGCWRLGWYARHSYGELRTPLPGAAETLPALEPGSRWRLQVRLKRPRGLVNPGGLDRERAALQARIAAVGYVRDGEGDGDGTGNRQLAAGTGLHLRRDRMAADIDAALPGQPRMAALLRGLAVGDRRGFAEADWLSLRRTGTSHLFSISGLHVGMVALVVAFAAGAAVRCSPSLLRRAPRPVWTWPPALLAAGGYALLAGMDVPTQRSLAMLAVAAAVLLLRRGGGLWQGWCLALAAVLVVDPLAMLGVGFWLSFGGVAWLLVAAQGRRRQAWWRAAPQAQWAVTLGLLPIGIGFFAQASWIAPLVNLVAVPWVTLAVVPVLLLALLLHAVWPPAGDLLVQLAAASLAPLMAGIDRLAAWPGAAATVPEPTMLAVAAACLAALLCLLPLGRLRWLALPLALPLLLPMRLLPGDGDVQVDVLDVGQGTAVLVRTRRHALLVDAGARLPNGYDVGEAVVVPALQALGVRRLDRLLVSHADNDHAGGAAAIARELPVRQVLLGEPLPDLDGAPCGEGGRWRWDGVQFELLHPPAGYPTRGNERSCVLHVRGRHGSVLLPGDAGGVAELRLLNLHRPRLASDVLLLGHHGSQTSTSATFLDAVAPTLAIATAGYRNRFGHPHRDVLQRVRMRGIGLADTVANGAIAIRIDADGVRWQGRRQARRRAWHEP
jgi:competence protein ComEC